MTSSPEQKALTAAGEAALYFDAHPDQLPADAPSPRKDAAGFAKWWREQNKTVKLEREKP